MVKVVKMEKLDQLGLQVNPAKEGYQECLDYQVQRGIMDIQVSMEQKDRWAALERRGSRADLV